MTFRRHSDSFNLQGICIKCMPNVELTILNPKTLLLIVA